MFFRYSCTQISSVTSIYFALVSLCIGSNGESKYDNHS